jgi:hypothetical protein
VVVEVNRLAPDVDDGFEPDEFRQMLESEPWRRYAERLSAMLQQEAERCLAVGVDPREADVARGAVKALRMAVELPGLMVEEFEEERRR